MTYSKMISAMIGYYTDTSGRLAAEFLTLKTELLLSGSHPKRSHSLNDEQIHKVVLYIGLMLTQVPNESSGYTRDGLRICDSIFMEFSPEPNQLRRLGRLFLRKEGIPTRREFLDVVGSRRELYKMEVKVPSDLIGFNLDAIGCGYQTFGVHFDVYDGGNALGRQFGWLNKVGDFEIKWLENGQMKGTGCLDDFKMNHIHDIDAYPPFGQN